MKRLTVLTFFGLFLCLSSMAQTKIGIKVSPSLSTNRTRTTDTVSANGSGFKVGFGPIFDIPFTANENYYFSTGILFAPKRAGVSFGDSTSEAYDLQYIQVPISLKLFTNEIGLDKKLYFQIGGVAELKVFEEPSKRSYNFVRSFRPFDFAVVFSGGMEYRIGVSTILFAGVSYQRGLIPVMKDVTPDLPKDKLRLKSDYISLDLGIKF